MKYYILQATNAPETEPSEEEEDKKLKIAPLSKIMKTNAKEWPFILGGVIGAAIQGCSIPLFAVLFGEVLGVNIISFISLN